MGDMVALGLLPPPCLKKAGSRETDKSSPALSLFHLGSNSDRRQVADQRPRVIALGEIWSPSGPPSQPTAAPIDSSSHLMQIAEAEKRLPGPYSAHFTFVARPDSLGKYSP